MKTLSYPQIDNLQLWSDIVSHKHQPAKSILLPLRDKIRSRYTFYSEHFEDLDQILPLPANEWSNAIDELTSCYGYNKEFKSIRQSLTNFNHSKCPYCLLNRANTLDHYFDKASYPEFSVYIPNLVPCCSECNSLKGASLFDTYNNRKFIHFYHDYIPEDQFIFIRFSQLGSDNVPVVKIALNFNEENYSSNLVDRHFASLSLLSKYKEEVVNRIPSIIDEIQMSHQDGSSLDTIVNNLQIRFSSLARHFGNNYWETCMYEGILNSPGFLDHLLSI